MILEHVQDAEAGFAGHVLVYRVTAALDGLATADFQKELCAAIEAEKPQALVLACEDMPYLTSSGLRAIMTLGKMLMAGQGKLVLTGLDGLAAQIFTTSGFSTIFPVVADLAAAKAILDPS